VRLCPRVPPDLVYSAHSDLQHPSRFLGDAVRELRRAPAVAWRLFRGNLQARHRRAWLGWLWLFLPALGTTAVCVYVQSRSVVDVAPTALPYPLYVRAGTMLWQLFTDALNAPLQQLAAGQQMITRSRVPHEALILAGLYEALLHCAVRCVMLVPVLLAFRIPLTSSLLLVPIGLLSLAILGLACGVLAAPLGMLYDDVARGLALMTAFLFFLSPIVYPARVRWNPIAPLLETTRAWLTGGAAANGFAIVTAGATTALLLAWLFLRLHPPELMVPRVTTAAVPLGSTTIPAPALVNLCIAAATRDPVKFERASELRLDRPPQRHFAFGSGIHHCIGATLGRRTIEAAVRALLAREVRATQPLDSVVTWCSITACPVGELQVDATPPGGPRQVLIEVPRWEFNWQGVYQYEKPVEIPAGTKLTVTAVYDNSAANRRNPNSPPPVSWGERTNDEMCVAMFGITWADGR
jgi:lipopolysaccharide transport system permease protein